MTGTDIVHVPHKASGEARNSVLGGHVQMMFDAITTMAENVRAGQVRALGTSGATRTKIMPDVPTVAEAGVPGYETTIWLGIMAPKKTPADIIAKLNKEMQAMMDSPDLVAAWDKQGAVPMKMTPAQFEEMLNKDIAKWAKVVKDAGIKPI
jgi:tripartite-type tricarboxylate transporter receptor subunit TctC